jgi:ribosomal protein L20
MTDASFLYSESQSKRKYNKSDVDAILIKRYGVDSATKLKKYQYDELMESLKK